MWKRLFQRKSPPPTQTLTASTAEAPPGTAQGDLALVMSGGGARAAYQVGILRAIGRQLPQARFPVITGVSAGAINATFLASHPGPLPEAAEALYELWDGLEVDHVFDVHSWDLLGNALRWMIRLGSGGSRLAPRVQGLVDTGPLRGLLSEALCGARWPPTSPTDAGKAERSAPPACEIRGIGDNIRAGRLKATALTTLDYDSGRTVTWVEGADFDTWERPGRLSRRVRLTVDHVLASAALPLLFPAVRLGDTWHGDGGIRLAAPLAPAIHLGANRLLILSTRYLPPGGVVAPSLEPAAYPPPAQIAGKLLNSIFLDLIDQDVARLRRINTLVERVKADQRDGFRPIRSLVLRPSEDLGRLSARYEPRLPKAFRFLTRGLGTRETSSPDFLSLLMFQPDYLNRLIAIGERDAQEHMDEITRLLAG